MPHADQPASNQDAPENLPEQDSAPAEQVTPAAAPAGTAAADTAPADAMPGPSPRRRRRLMKIGALTLALGLTVAAFTVPVDKVIEAPGPTWNVLDDGSTPQSQDLLTIQGLETYPTQGELRMTTISQRGCPGYPVTTAEVIGAWFSREKTVLDREQICPKGVTQEEIRSTHQATMTSSQDAAVVAALNEVGETGKLTLSVSSLAEQQTSSDLQPGDVLLAITPQGGQRTEITSYSQLREVMTTIPVGTRVTLEIRRGEEKTTAELTTIAHPEGVGSLLGVRIHFEVDPEVKVSFALSDVGGPSAGLMFALGIVDEITPGNLTGGRNIAGTGTIALDGTVGPIGGIRHKMAGAGAAGATYFLAPAQNCAEVVGHEPEGMTVYAVDSLHTGVETVQAIGRGQTSGLTTCSDAVAQSS